MCYNTSNEESRKLYSRHKVSSEQVCVKSVMNEPRRYDFATVLFF